MLRININKLLKYSYIWQLLKLLSKAEVTVDYSFVRVATLWPGEGVLPIVDNTSKLRPKGVHVYFGLEYRIYSIKEAPCSFLSRRVVVLKIKIF